MNEIKTNQTLDAQGLACPMPIVKTKKAMNELESGQVLEILATDKGSTADMKAWAERTGHDYLGTIGEGKVLKHFLRKCADEEVIEKKHPDVISNEELERKLQESVNTVLIDVREDAEYAFNHIPEAISIPLGELESNVTQLNKEEPIYIICRTGNRSDMAAQILTENGFKHVLNVMPGMSEWTGKTINRQGVL